MDIFWVRVIIGVIIFLLIFGESIQRATRGINPTGWHMPTLPQANWRFILASLAGIAVLWIRIEGWILHSFLKYDSVITILLVALVFWVVYNSMYSWIGWLIGAMLVLEIIGGIRSCGSSKPNSVGKPIATTTKYQPGDVIYDGMTPCHPVIPCEFSLTPTGPVKEVWETTSGIVTQRIGETAPSAPNNRKRDRPVVITSLTAGTEYHVIIIAR
ncbi:MAG: hypothetical protein NTW98_01210 [Candidatus Nomurabacteria bacterium]|nr:hypothetical protein [Candidatus Nomurabacteria bacterium]